MESEEPPYDRPEGGALALRRGKRELFFWTARETLKLVVAVAVTIYFVIFLAQGRIWGYEGLLELAARLITLLR